jgi:NarL family two-component system response regulator LiaR
VSGSAHPHPGGGAQQPGRRIAVLVVDDHAVVRQGLRTFLELQEDIDVVGEAADGAAAVEQAERLAPDVVLMDLAMPGTDGVTAIRALRERVPDARAIALTSFSDDERVFGAVRAGAAGYLLKDTDPAELVAGIRTVAAGQGLLSPPVAARLLEELATDGGPAAGEATAGLTPREREVLLLIARGRSNKRIALELGVAEKTVKTHVGHVLAKLGVSDRTQAALWAVRHGLTD